MAVSTAHKKKNGSKAKMKADGFQKTAEKIHQETISDMMYVNKMAEIASSKTDDPELLKAIEGMRNMANRKVEQVGKMKDDDNGDAQHRSKYTDWGQFNLDVSQIARLIVLQDMKNSSTAMKIFFHIIRSMDRTNCYIASYKVFEETLGISKSNVQRGISTLQKMGLLSIIKAGGANIYMIDPTTIWKGYGNVEGTVKFNATVELSTDEKAKLQAVIDAFNNNKTIPCKTTYLIPPENQDEQP